MQHHHTCCKLKGVLPLYSAAIIMSAILCSPPFSKMSATLKNTIILKNNAISIFDKVPKSFYLLSLIYFLGFVMFYHLTLVNYSFVNGLLLYLYRPFPTSGISAFTLLPHSPSDDAASRSNRGFSILLMDTSTWSQLPGIKPPTCVLGNDRSTNESCRPCSFVKTILSLRLSNNAISL